MAWTIVRTPVRGQTHQDAGEFDHADDACRQALAIQVRENDLHE
jgi:hypothetical protein